MPPTLRSESNLTNVVRFQVHTSPTLKGRLRMSSPGFQKSKRSWQEIAAEAFVEKDPAKLQRLAEELAEATPADPL